jgi:hypothetical protein
MMPRVLTMHRATIPVSNRSQYLEKLRARRNHYTSNGCNFWAFEEVGLPGAFIEFTEAADEKTLGAAHIAWPARSGDINRVYREVELG